MNHSKNIKDSASDSLFNIINTIFLTLCFIVVLFPILNVISQSLSSPKAVISGRVFIWPVEPTLMAYKKILTFPTLLRGYANSIFYTVAGTSLNVVLAVMAAYPLSRKDFYGKKAIVGIFVFTMMFNGGLIPTYLVVKSLGMIDTFWVMIIPNAINVFYIMIARTFFQTTIPEEMFEAAEIDGASDLKMLFQVVLPVSAPIIAVLVLFNAVHHWNSYFHGFIYLQTEKLFPLQVVLRNILSNAQAIEQMAAIPSKEQMELLSIVEVLKYAIIVFASIPVLLLYPFVQKHFVKGIMIGSLKG